MEATRIEKLYNIKAVCAALGSPRSTVIHWIREGRLTAFKLPGGRRWHITESDLVAFINSGKRGTL